MPHAGGKRESLMLFVFVALLAVVGFYSYKRYFLSSAIVKNMLLPYIGEGLLCTSTFKLSYS